MIAKLFEVRDHMTFIPVMAVRLGQGEENRYLLSRAGYGTQIEQQRKYLLLTKLTNSETSIDPTFWNKNSRTMYVAHRFISDNWDGLTTGDVIDVEFILGEVSDPKISEQRTSESTFGPIDDIDL